MNSEFEAKAALLPELFDQLVRRPEEALTSKFPTSPAIYVFYENGLPVHIGRTRNLKQRLRAHVSNNQNSASFAFKRLRRRLSLPTTYKKEGSRSAIQTTYPDEFLSEIAHIRAMTVRYLEVSDKIQQYIFELYTALELSKYNPEIDMKDFDTH